MRILHILLTAVALAATLDASAQDDRYYVRNGNKLFRQGQHEKAELEYRKALTQNDQNTQALYNIGCAMMMMQKDSLAIEQFKLAGAVETNAIRRAMSYHNIGVDFQMNQDYAKAIEAYKEALRNNPHDDQTRYNLALCKELLKKQQQQKKDQNKDKDKDQDKEQNKDKDKEQNKDKQNQDKNQDKDKQNQDKDKNKDQKDGQDKQDQNDKKDKQQSDRQNAGQQQMSKENAEQLLNAAVQAEKATQQRLQQALQQPQRKKLQKNW